MKHKVRELNNSIARERREIGRRIDSIKYLILNLKKLESAAQALDKIVSENVDPNSSPAKSHNMEKEHHNDTTQNDYEDISDESDSEQSESIDEDEKKSASTTYINLYTHKPFIYLGITREFKY